ncbi:MAG: fumarylacetoacetate hydrolase family protein, partial [Pseudomonadota bacterium]
MKLLTFRKDGHDHLGAVRDDAIVDLTTALSTDPRFGSMQALIEGGDDALTQAAATLAHTTQTLPADQVEWRAPLPRPPQLRDFLSFELHLKNSFEAALKLAAQEADDPVAAEATLRASGRFNIPDVWYRQPIYYKGNRFAVAATGEDIPWPAYSKVMDYELELACVIGHAGRDIPRDQAHEHIFGYTVFNDFSARDAQVAEQQGMLGPAKGKDFDKANVLGPVIVTRDEIPDPYQL